MAIDYAKAIAAVEVFALKEVRNAPCLVATDGEIQFKHLILDTVTLIVEEHLAGGVRFGGRHVDGEDDGDGDGPRLHLWLEKSGATYKLVILRYDCESRTPPVVTDTMAIVHGERVLMARFVIFRDPRSGSIAIEHIPSGRFSDDRPAPEVPRRPSHAIKPVVHRTAATLSTWWRAATAGIRCLLSAVCHARGAAPMTIDRRNLKRWLAIHDRGQGSAFDWSRLKQTIEATLIAPFIDAGIARWVHSRAQPNSHEKAWRRLAAQRPVIGLMEHHDLTGAHLAKVHGLKPDLRRDSSDHQREIKTEARKPAETDCGGVAPQ